MTELKRTPVFSEYKKDGAKTIDFGGWDLPVQFSKITEEHEAAREKAALFDVSHMGEIIVEGTKSLNFLEEMTTNNIRNLTPNKAQYTFLCNENGGVIDDFLIYMLNEDKYLLVVNAANTEKDYTWLREHNSYQKEEVTVKNVSDEYGLLAIQGPLAEKILQRITDTDLTLITPFRFEKDVVLDWLEDKAMISRTGYTGEDGFEIYIASRSVAKLWNIILGQGKEDGIIPAGLGARDTLRFEAGLPLYGQELTEEITPIEAGLSFAVKVNKDTDFIGKDVLKEQIETGPQRKIVGIKMVDKGIPRTGYEVLIGDNLIGYVTTGTKSPTLQDYIGNALIDAEYGESGTEVHVQVRKRKLKAEVVPTPFYHR